MKHLMITLTVSMAAFATSALAAFDDRPYRTQGAWQVYAVFENGKYFHCSAETRSGSNRMRLIKFAGNDTLMVATPTTNTRQFEGGVAFNGVGDAVKFSTFNGWAVHSTTDSHIFDMLTQGREMSLDVGRGYVNYSLDGVEGVLSALRTCAARAGQGGNQAIPAGAQAPATAAPVRCASENQMCQFTGRRTVIYGARSQTISKVMDGPVMCTNAAFGTDPAPNIVKSCSLQ